MRLCKADKQPCVLGLMTALWSVGPFVRDWTLQTSDNCIISCVFPNSPQVHALIPASLNSALWRTGLLAPSWSVQCYPLYVRALLALALGPPWLTLRSDPAFHTWWKRPTSLTAENERGDLGYKHMSSFLQPLLVGNSPAIDGVLSFWGSFLPGVLYSLLTVTAFIFVSVLGSWCLSTCSLFTLMEFLCYYQYFSFLCGLKKICFALFWLE